jgi:hypothetical protein
MPEMETIELDRDSTSGAYKRAEKSSDYKEHYYTAFCRFNWGSGDEDFSVEEIDILARDGTDARVIASAALAQDYEVGGRVVEMIERQKGWIFHDV